MEADFILLKIFFLIIQQKHHIVMTIAAICSTVRLDNS